ncbi:MAG: relaxase/mobilization nuclease domain-containing protein [Clostridia bacterium]|nr:relaxase/mobilization nuclease domain-containing protein [Clostridia bacterium]
MKIKYKDGKNRLPSVMGAVIDYCLQPHKTEIDEKVHAVSGQNCTPEFAYRQFMATKASWNKTDGVCFGHYVQSFHPSEQVTPEEANRIGMEFAQRAWEGYEVVIATHIDREHIHNHFVVSTVHPDTGLKLHENRSNIENLRRISDEICVAHGLSVLTPYKRTKTKSISSREYRAGSKGDSWKFRLRAAINASMSASGSREEFVAQMYRLGYAVRWEDRRKNITYTCLKEAKYKNGAYRKCNDDKLSDEKYLKGRMELEFEYRKEILAGRNDSEKRNAGRGTAEALRADRLRYSAGSMGGDALADEELRRFSAADGEDPANALDQGKPTTNRPGDGQNDQRFSELGGGRAQEASCFDTKSDAELPLRGAEEAGTGWEGERAKWQANRLRGQRVGGRALGQAPKHVEDGVGHGHRLGGTLIASLGSSLLSASLSGDRKSPEEIEAEEEARRSAQNIGALAGVAVGVAMMVGEHGEEVTEEYEDEDITNDPILSM